MLQIERRRLALGWPMWLIEERSGVQSGYYAKMLYAETPSGRAAGWLALQWVIDALWPDGIGIRFTGDRIADDEEMREKIKRAAARYQKRRRRELLRTRTHLRDYACAKEAQP